MIAVLLLAAGLTFVPPDKGNPDRTSFAAVTSKKLIPPDPGPAPAFVASEYVPYSKPGGVTVTGAPSVTLSSGRKLPCGDGMWARLYPNTPYTQWMIANFLYFVYKTNTWRDPAVLAGAPDYLDAHSPSTIVRQADCSNGTFEARGLPEGNYVALALVEYTGSEGLVSTSVETGMTPDGRIAPIYHNTITDTATTEDGFLLIEGVYKITHPTGTYRTNDDGWYVYAHISTGR